MKFENNRHAPARAIITIDALIMSDHEKQPVTASGNYCSPRKNFTFGMTYTVSVQAPDEDVNVTFYEEDNYQQ
jgi:hypothetical protein